MEEEEASLEQYNGRGEKESKRLYKEEYKCINMQRNDLEA